MHYSSLFRYCFYRSTIVPTPGTSWKFNTLVYYLLLQIILIDKPAHSGSMGPHASIISESEICITALYLLCLPSYTAVRIQNCLKSTSVIKVATVKNMIVPRTSIIVWNWSIHCPSLSTHHTAVQIKNCLESTSVIKVAAMKNTDNFRYAKEAITCNHQINAFYCQQRWMEHKGRHW